MVEKQYLTPAVGVFITYQHTNYKRWAGNTVEDGGVEILGEQIKLEKVKEPSNYIWENLHYSQKRQRTGSLIAVLVLSIILFTSYLGQFNMQK